MSFSKITSADLANKGVVGMDDTPNLSTLALQKKFDEIATDVIVPKHNTLVAEMEASTAAASIGAVVPTGITAEANVQAVINAIGSGQSALNDKTGAARVGAVSPLNSSTTTVQGALNTIYSTEQSDKSSLTSQVNTVKSDLTTQINKVSTNTTTEINSIKSNVNTFENNLRSTKGASLIGATVPSGIVSSANTVQEVIEEVYTACKNNGDMTKKVYDKQNRGYVDHAEVADKLSDLTANDIQTKTDTTLETTSKTVAGAINELKRSSEIFDSTAMFYIDANGHYCVDTLQATEIIAFRVVDNHLNITVNV